MVLGSGNSQDVAVGRLRANKRDVQSLVHAACSAFRSITVHKPPGIAMQCSITALSRSLESVLQLARKQPSHEHSYAEFIKYFLNILQHTVPPLFIKINTNSPIV